MLKITEVPSLYYGLHNKLETKWRMGFHITSLSINQKVLFGTSKNIMK